MVQFVFCMFDIDKVYSVLYENPHIRKFKNVFTEITLFYSYYILHFTKSYGKPARKQVIIYT